MGLRSSAPNRDTSGAALGKRLANGQRNKISGLANMPKKSKGFYQDRNRVLKHNDFLREHLHLLQWPYDEIFFGGEEHEAQELN